MWVRARRPSNGRESLWWLVHRFLILNRPTNRDLQEQFGRPKATPRSGTLVRSSAVYRHNQSVGSWIEWQSLCVASGISLHALHPPLLDGKCTLFEDGVWFCEPCLRAGFHSAWFSGPLLVNCPIHGTPLRDTCPQCHEPLPNGLHAEVIKRPGRCQCGWRFLPLDRAARGTDRIPGIERLDMYVRWIASLASRLEREIPLGTGREGLLAGSNVATLDRWQSGMPIALRATQILRQWNSGTRASGESPESSRRSGSPSRQATGRQSVTPPNSVGRPTEAQFAEYGCVIVATVKAIRRRLLGQRLRGLWAGLGPPDHPLAENRFAPRHAALPFWRAHFARIRWNDVLLSSILRRSKPGVPGMLRSGEAWSWLSSVCEPEVSSTISSSVATWLISHLAAEVTIGALARGLSDDAGRQKAERTLAIGRVVKWHLDQRSALLSMWADRPGALDLRNRVRRPRVWRCCLAPDGNWSLRHGETGAPSIACGTWLAHLPARYARRLFNCTGDAIALQWERADVEVVGETAQEAIRLQWLLVVRHRKLMEAVDWAVPPSGKVDTLEWHLPASLLQKGRAMEHQSVATTSLPSRLWFD